MTYFKKLMILLVMMLPSVGTMASTITFAWINSPTELEIITDSPNSINAQDLQILDGANKSHLFEIMRKTSDSVVLKVPENFIDQKNYLIKTVNQEVYAYYSLEYANTNFNYTGPLGVKLEANKTKATFKLWSPTAESVTVFITNPISEKIILTSSLVRKSKGLWETTIDGSQNLEGLHYQYKVHAFGKDFTALDPYAKSMGAFNPKADDKVGFGAIILDPINQPYQPLNNHYNDTNFIGMEVHVRDATISPSSPAVPSLKGTYQGLVSALAYYKNLGVTHLQLLPLQNFYTVNESKRAYQGLETPKSEINYNWGYDPQNYFTPEGWFSTDATNPYSRINELQVMTKEIHRSGMGIILDVVYNHVFAGNFFEAAAPGMYLRRNRRGEVSGATGAGESIESRSFMARRLIVNSLKYWQDIYHIDGFRFDLMGFLDKDTMREIRSSLHPETILYGEAWVFTDLPMQDATVKTDLPHELNIGAFNDTSRDSYAGRNEGRGFVQGNFNDHQKVRSGIIGGIKNHPQGDLIGQNNYDSFAENPLETLNYLTIHDGFTLWDKINLSVGGDFNKRMQIAKNAYAMLFTSQGRVVFPQGCEAGRSKPLYSNDPYPERAHTSAVAVAENGISYFHENSFSSSDATNQFDWERAKQFSELQNYVKGLIAIRKKFAGLRLTDADSIRNDLRFLPQSTNGVMAYFIDGLAEQILVIHNGESNSHEASVPEITNPEEWHILADCKQAGVSPILSNTVRVVNGKVTVNETCSTIIVKTK